MKFKKIMKNNILYFINKPADNILSSQTLYECLLGCLDLYDITKEEHWLAESSTLAKLIVNHQNSDGGFNIGYDFIFGKDMSKKGEKESTTPEILSLYALKKYHNLTKDISVEEAISKGLDWLISNIKKINENEYAVPYAPLTNNEVHITNATSFSAGTLSLFVEESPNLKKYVEGMNKYMLNQLEKNEKGYYWRYFDRYSSNFKVNTNKNKVDNYHIGQQLRYHCVSYTNCKDQNSYEIISKVQSYLLNNVDSKGWIPYVETTEGKTDKIDLWGYSSVLKGLADSSDIIKDSNDLIKKKINQIFENIYKYSWNGTYFNPIIFENGKVYDRRFYPRSDAWVFHSILHSYQLLDSENKKIALEISKENYQEIKKRNFRGLENHAISPRKVIFSKIISLVRKEN